MELASYHSNIMIRDKLIMLYMNIYEFNNFYFCDSVFISENLLNIYNFLIIYSIIKSIHKFNYKIKIINFKF